MADHLKAMLVDDWENVTKNQQLVPIPHAHPVEQLLNDYVAHERPRREEGSAAMDVLDEVVAGLREYFNKALGRILLYKYVPDSHMFHQATYSDVLTGRLGSNDHSTSRCTRCGRMPSPSTRVLATPMELNTSVVFLVSALPQHPLFIQFSSANMIKYHFQN